MLTRRCRSSRGRKRTAFAVAILVAQAARLRHGQDTAISRPGRRLGVRKSLPVRHGASPEGPPAITERTLALVPRAKYPHCFARARDGLISLPPLHSLTRLLHRLRRSLPLISKSSKLTRPSMQTAGAPKLQTAKTSSLRSSRGSNLHCVLVLADRARACDKKWPRDYVRPENY